MSGDSNKERDYLYRKKVEDPDLACTMIGKGRPFHAQ